MTPHTTLRSAQRLDEFKPLVDIPRIDMIKIDVEGSEPDVPEGMTSLIATGRVRYVLCEFNSWWLNANGTTVENLAARFHAMGFEVEDNAEWTRGPASGGGTFDLQTSFIATAKIDYWNLV